MATIEELVIKIQADNQQLAADMKAASNAVAQATNLMSKQMDSIAQDTKKSAGFMRGALQSFTGFLLADVVQGGFNLLKNAASSAFNALVTEGIKAASESQTAFSNLSNAFQRTGRSAEEAEDFFLNFADGLEQSSLATGEQIASAATLLTQMTKLSNQGLKDATQSAVDLSAALGVDLDQAARLVGKAVEGNGEALRKFGITLDTSADKTKNAEMVLKQLQDRFGGAAAAQIQTFDGALNQLGDAFGNLQKFVGGAITNNKAVIGVINAVANAFTSFNQALGSNEQAFNDLIANGVVKAVAMFKFLIQAAIEVSRVIAGIVDTFSALGKGIGVAMAAIAQAVSGDFTAAKETLTEGTREIAMEFGSSVTAVDALGNKVLSVFPEIESAAKKGAEEVAAGQIGMRAEFQQTAEKSVEMSNEYKAMMADAEKFAQELAKSGQQGGTLDQEALQAQFEAGLITEQEYYDQKKEMLIAQQEFEAEQIRLARESDKLSLEEKYMAELALAQGHHTAMLKLETETAKKKQEMRMRELEATSQLFGGIGDLARAFGKENNALAKASGIAQATINTYVGATKALAQGGIVGPVLAAAVIASGIAQVAKIAATPLATGIDSVPGIGAGDNFPAILAPGERVVPRETNKDLTGFLKERDSEPKTVMNVSVTISDVFTSDPREVGMKLIEHINEAAQANGVQMLSSRIQ